MFMIHHASYWNGRRYFARDAEYPATKLTHDITLPMGGFFRLILLTSKWIPNLNDNPFGLQEDHFITKSFGEGMAFWYKDWNPMHMALVVQDNMMFVALSKTELPLLDLMEDYARDDHKLAEYIPLCYAA